MSIFRKIQNLSESLLLRAVAEPRKMTIQLDVTNACNLSCTHCYHSHHMNSGAIGQKEWVAILGKIEVFLRKYHLDPQFMFCGGEPLLSPLFKPLVLEVQRIWPAAEIMVLTNGTVVRNSLYEVLNPENTSFQISLDGPDSLRHDAVRGPGNFKKSLVGIESFLSHGYSVAILSILSQRTSCWIGEYFDLAKQTGATAQNFTRLVAQGHGKKLVEGGTDFPLAGTQLKNALVQILIDSYRTGVQTNTNQPLFALIDPNFGQNGLFGFDSLVVDYKGNLKVTSRSNFTVGNLLNQDLDDIYIKNEILSDLRSAKIDVCGECELYASCGGDRNAAYAEYGSFTARDPGCWK